MEDPPEGLGEISSLSGEGSSFGGKGSEIILIWNQINYVLDKKTRIE